MPQRLIDTQEKINDVCRLLAGRKIIGVDTEFLRVRTYYPKLALIQISTREQIFCVDPLARGVQLDEFWEILQAPEVLKVMHAARQDIEVLLHTADVMPRPLFDTQIAAGLLGHGEQVGYAGLVKTEFGEDLPKGVQRTDWTRRPLSEGQIGYAENDVRYLLPLHDRLTAQLESRGRLEWAREDFERILDPVLYQADPDQAYRRVGRGAHLEPRAQHDLKRLCAWREEAARDRDLPRSWVLDDDTLVAIAAAGPRSLADLEAVDAVKREILQRDGGTMVRCLASEREGEEPLWSRRSGMTPGEKTLKAELVSVLKEHAARLGIAESVLVTRGDLEKMARGAPPVSVIEGWRLTLLGDDLEKALSGRALSECSPEGVA